MRWALVVLLLWFGKENALRAQDLTGQWTGSAIDDAHEGRQKIVLSLSSGDSSIGGVLHWYIPETHTIRHILISGRYYGRDSILTIREDSASSGAIGAERIGMPRPPGFFILYFKRVNHKDILEGHWSVSVGGSTRQEGMNIRLEKKAPPFIPVILPKKNKDSALARQLDSLLSRQSVVAATIPVPPQGTDSVRISLYDNGEIDGDSVSLYLNNELLLQHVKLTAEAKTIIIAIDKSLPVNRLVLFAENMGKLPPNTALMEVTFHGKTYDLFLSTDYKRNAAVEFPVLQE